tara:strand:- start:1109 stop:2914 length:1806 start_codon:yes stop_codon:yes gene_type:complete
MGAALEVVVAVETSTDTWTDISADVMSAQAITISYGISGDKPLDCVAGTGSAQFSVNGYKYSFEHADVLSGWAFGARIRVILYRTLDTPQSVSSLTAAYEWLLGTVGRSELGQTTFLGEMTSTATVTTSGSHGYSSGDWVTIAGASPSTYNGTFRITVTSTTTFTYGLGSLTPAVTASGTITARLGYLKHNGKLRSANPAPGAYRTRRVAVTSYDGMRDLAETRLRDVAIQINQSESELITTILDAVPAAAQPLYRSIAAGVDTYPYAFNELRGGALALSVIKNVCVSGFGVAIMRGDGTFEFQSRHTRTTGTPAYHFNETMQGLSTNASIDEFVNHVQTTISPRSVDSAATTKVYAATGAPFAVAAGETVTMIVQYRDPENTDTLIGAVDVVNCTATTDFLGNANAAGTGTNLTSSLAVVTTQYGSSATLAITNNHASAAIYLVNASGAAFLQLRGKGVYEKSPQTFTAQSSQPYGDKTLSIALTYQSDPVTAQAYASVVEEKYNSSASAQLQSIDFAGNASPDLLLHALAREPGDIIQVSETNVGASEETMVIQSVKLRITSGPWVTATFGLAPSSSAGIWMLGTVGQSENGLTTTLGF